MAENLPHGNWYVKCNDARIGGCRMPPSPLEILRSIPDRRRAEGKRFDLATVPLYTILGMVA